MSSVGVLGAGTWGTALARMLSNSSHGVTVWSISQDEVDVLSTTRRNKNLSNNEIPEEIVFTTDISLACRDKDILPCAVPSVFICSTISTASAYISSDQIIVDVAKGIEADTLSTMTEVIRDELSDGKHVNIRVVSLSGSTHAEEVAQDLPTTIASACEDFAIAELVQELFSNTFMRVYIHKDVRGVEICGVLKNIIALAAGISAGLGYGDNTKAALITRVS